MAASIMKVWFFLASQGAQGKRGVWDGIGQPRGCRCVSPMGCGKFSLGAVFFFFHLGSEYIYVLLLLCVYICMT